MRWYFLKITYPLESSMVVYIIIICIKNILCGTSATPKLYFKYQTYTSSVLTHDLPARRKEMVCFSACARIFGSKLQSEWFVNCGSIKRLNEFVHLVLIGLEQETVLWYLADYFCLVDFLSGVLSGTCCQ